MDEFLIQTEHLHLTELEFLLRLLMATGIGFVIGLEREHHSQEEEKDMFAGVRTFIFIVLTGFLGTIFGEIVSPLVLVTAFAGFLLVIALAYWGKMERGRTGGTTVVAMILAFLLGGVTAYGYFEIALPIMVIMLLALSTKVRMHTFIGKFSQEEVFALIQFVSIAALLIPFLPSKDLGPYEALNPYEIGLVVVIVSGLSFGGYLLVKFLSAGKGIILSGILGGMASSTAIAWIFSKRSRESSDLAVSCAIAILAASTLMVPRVLILVYLFNPSLLGSLWIPFAVILITGFAVSYFFYRKYRPKDEEDSEVPLSNPLNLRDAIIFALLFAGITVLVQFANDKLGASGTYISSIIGGLPNIDAITISMSKLGEASINKQVALNAIMLAALSNTIVKAVIALTRGSTTMRKYILAGFGTIFVAGLAGLAILNFV